MGDLTSDEIQPCHFNYLIKYMDLIECPVCRELFPQDEIERHVNVCLDSQLATASPPMTAGTPAAVVCDKVPPPIIQTKDPQKDQHSLQEDNHPKHEKNTTEGQHVIKATYAQINDLDLKDWNTLSIAELTEYTKKNGSTSLKSVNSKRGKYYCQRGMESEQFDSPPQPKPTQTSDIPSPLLRILDDDRYFDVLFYFPLEENKVIRAHSFILSIRSPLFLLELKDMQRVDGIFLYQVTDFSYLLFKTLIEVIYGVTPLSTLTKIPMGPELQSLYSASKQAMEQDIIGLSDLSCCDVHFIVDSDNSTVSHVGFSRILLYNISDYFKSLMDEKYNEYLASGKTRDKSQFSVPFDISQYLPPSDPGPLVITLHVATGGERRMTDGLKVLLHNLYLQGSYEGSTEMAPTLLYLSDMFNFKRSSTEYESIICQKLVVTLDRWNDLHSSIRNDRVLIHITPSVLNHVRVTNKYDTITSWKKTSVIAIFRHTPISCLGALEKDNSEDQLLGLTDFPDALVTTSFKDIPTLTALACIAFVRSDIPLCVVLSRLYLKKIGRILQRKDLIEIMAVHGFVYYRDIIHCCVAGIEMGSTFASELKKYLSELVGELSYSYNILSETRGYLCNTDVLDGAVHQCFDRNCLCFYVFNILLMIQHQHDVPFVTRVQVYSVKYVHHAIRKCAKSVWSMVRCSVFRKRRLNLLSCAIGATDYGSSWYRVTIIHSINICLYFISL